jgi:hypothetical protein
MDGRAGRALDFATMPVPHSQWGRLMQARIQKFALLLTSLCFLGFLPSAALAGDWAAFALSTKTGAWGTSYNYDDEEDARDRAMSECRKHASDCKVFRTVKNVCVILAGDKAGNFGWAWGYTPSDRRRRAINQCREYGGGRCQVLTRFCTGSAKDDDDDD